MLKTFGNINPIKYLCKKKDELSRTCSIGKLIR